MVVKSYKIKPAEGTSTSNEKQEEVSQDPTQAKKVLETAEKVCKLVKEKLGLPESSTTVTKETNFGEGLDVSKTVEIYDEIEKQFDISFHKCNLENVFTLYQIATVIEDPKKYQQQQQTKEEEKNHVHDNPRTRSLLLSGGSSAGTDPTQKVLQDIAEARSRRSQVRTYERKQSYCY
ncbi:hypothetical protein OROHE_010970 [Orobanche hederae]